MISLALLTCCVLPQSPSSALDPTVEARALYRSVMTRYVEAASLQFRCAFVQRARGVDGQLSWREGDFEFDIAKPLHGCVRHTGVRHSWMTSEDVDEPVEFRIIGDGQQVRVLDDFAKTTDTLDATAWSFVMMVAIPPLVGWSGRSTSVYDGSRMLLLSADPMHPDWRGVRIGSESNYTELWVDECEDLARAVQRSSQGPNDPMAETTEWTFRDVQVSDRADAEWPAVSIPADYVAPASSRTSKPSPGHAFAVGDELPDVTWTTIDGRRVRARDLVGMTVLIDFWFEQCGACMAEMPALERLWREFSSQRDDLAFVCVNLRDPPEAVRRLWESKQLTMQPVLQDFALVSTAFGVHAYPTHFVIGPDGKLLDRIVGSNLARVRQVLDSVSAPRRTDEELLEHARRWEARDELLRLQRAVTEFERARGRSPTGLSELTQADAASGAAPVLTALPLDPWQRAYVWRRTSDGRGSVVCLGRDGVPGGLGVDADIDAREL